MSKIQVHITFDELLNVVRQLTDEQKRILLAHLAASSTSPDKPRKERVAGLGQGTIWMSDDFDAPMAIVPDES